MMLRMTSFKRRTDHKSLDQLDQLHGHLYRKHEYSLSLPWQSLQKSWLAYSNELPEIALLVVRIMCASGWHSLWHYLWNSLRVYVHKAYRYDFCLYDLLTRCGVMSCCSTIYAAFDILPRQPRWTSITWSSLSLHCPFASRQSAFWRLTLTL